MPISCAGVPVYLGDLIVRATGAGKRELLTSAKLRDRRCKHTTDDIATALDGRYPRRQRLRPGSPTAVTATAHKVAGVVYAVIRHGAGYVKQTERVAGRGAKLVNRGQVEAVPTIPPASTVHAAVSLAGGSAN